MTEDGTHFPVPTTCGEGQCCGNDDLEDDVSGEVESHCGGGCCADDKDSDCGSNVEHCEDSCCEPQEDHGIHEEPVHQPEPRGTFRAAPLTLQVF